VGISTVINLYILHAQWSASVINSIVYSSVSTVDSDRLTTFLRQRQAERSLLLADV